MRIGILTFQDAINYGAILQAYALQKTIDKVTGNKSFLVNYNDKVINERYSPFEYTGINILKIVRTFLANNMAKKTQQEFTAFKERRLNITSSRYDIVDLNNLNNEFDYIIVGSDQVWNIDLTKNDLTYFLDFLEPSKKLSYAASFGIGEFDEDQMKLVKPLLSEFKRISVREKQGIEILKLMNIDGELVLDPSFLLSKNEWESISVKPRKLSKEYILVYTIGTNHELLRFAAQLAKEHNCKAYFINDAIKNRIDGVEVLRFLSPEEWVYAFLNAKIIVTNSFHGVAFSINFNKPFWVYPSMTNYKDTNSRIESILDLFNLKCCNKLLSNDNSYDIDSLNARLDTMKEASINYIRTSLYDK